MAAPTMLSFIREGKTGVKIKVHYGAQIRALTGYIKGAERQTTHILTESTIMYPQSGQRRIQLECSNGDEYTITWDKTFIKGYVGDVVFGEAPRPKPIFMFEVKECGVVLELSKFGSYSLIELPDFKAAETNNLDKNNWS